MATSALLKPLFDTLWGLQTSNYAAVAAVTVLAYDVLLTLGREVNFIWSTKNSLPKIMYLFVRYYGFAHIVVDMAFTTRLHLSLSACSAYLWWLPMGGAIVFTTAVNFILLMRIYALYERSMKVIYPLLALFVVEFGAEMYISIKTAVEGRSTLILPPLGLPIPGCLIEHTSQTLTLVAWIPCLGVAVVFFILTAYKFYTGPVIEHGYSWKSMNAAAFSPLLLAFIRDGTVFFFLIAVVLFMSTIITIAVEGAMKGVFLPYLIGTWSFAGSRLILNLREAATKGTGEEELTWEQTLSFRVAQRTGGEDNDFELEGVNEPA